MRKSGYPVMTDLFVHYFPTRGHCFFEVTAPGASASWWWFWNWSQSYLVRWTRLPSRSTEPGMSGWATQWKPVPFKIFQVQASTEARGGVWSPGAGAAGVWLEPQLWFSGWTVHALTTEPSLTLHKIVYVYRRLRDERPSGSKTHDAYIKILSKPMVGKVKYYKNREQCVLISLRFLRRKEVEVFASLARSSSCSPGPVAPAPPVRCCWAAQLESDGTWTSRSVVSGGTHAPRKAIHNKP